MDNNKLFRIGFIYLCCVALFSGLYDLSQSNHAVDSGRIWALMANAYDSDVSLDSAFSSLDNLP